MKKTAIVLLLATTLAGGAAACSQSTPQASQTDNGSTAVATNPQNAKDPAKAAERARKREEVKKQIETVLTPEQTKQFEAKLQEGTRMRRALASLNLTNQQKTKVQAILKAAYPRQNQNQNQAKS